MRFLICLTQNIKSRCDGKIIIIDTGAFVFDVTYVRTTTLSRPGISHAYGGVLSALSIQYTLKPIGGSFSQRWKEKEVVSAIYPDRREVIATSEREVVGDFEDIHQASPRIPT